MRVTVTSSQRSPEAKATRWSDGGEWVLAETFLVDVPGDGKEIRVIANHLDAHGNVLWFGDVLLFVEDGVLNQDGGVGLHAE